MTDPEHGELLDSVQQLMQKEQFAQALELVEPVAQREVEDTRAQYLYAVCLRYTGRLAKALKVLRRLLATAPSYARAHQELGHTQRALGDDNAALAAYQEAVALNPALHASWQALAALHEAKGDAEAAENAASHYRRLKELPPELLSVSNMLHEGRLLKAEKLCRAFLQRRPHHIEGMRLLAQIGAKVHVLDDAEFLLESAVELQPDNALVRFDYVNVLNRRQKYAESLKQSEILRRAQPGNPSFETAYASQCMAAGYFDEALQVYDQVLDKLPDNWNIHLMRGHVLKTVGRTDDAIAAYRSAYRAKPDFGDAFWSLANLKTYRFTDAEIEQMQAREAATGVGLVDRYHLCFALGKAFEDRQEHARSFEYYERGNALKKSELRYDPDRTQAEFDRQKEICTPELFTAKRDSGCPAPDPIFIVGLPRAGSTLIEQILASHSQIDGTMELPNILALAHRLSGRRKVNETPRYPAILHELSPEKLRELGEAFIEDTRIHRGNAPYFIDKMPNNFRHIGLIQLILPNAKIIDARREPMACCFSGFKQLFAEGQEFSYGLDDIGRYYRGYVELMDHWYRLFPDNILLVRYEEVVRDFETQVRRLLEFLGLPFEDACLDFHRTDRSVRTASSEQVRQPLYDSALEAWRPYEPFLDPLKSALGETLLGAD